MLADLKKALPLAAMVLAGLPALPTAAPANPAEHVVRSLEIIPGWETGAGQRMTGVQLRLAPGWKTYWRAPGEAGIPPHFDWSGSENLRAVRIYWPRPGVFESAGTRTIGYRDEVTFPVEIFAEDPAKPVRLKAQADFGVCRDICIPVSMQVEQAAGNAPDGAAGRDSIRAALADLPRPARAAGVDSVRCQAEPIRDGLRLTTRIDLPPQGGREVAVVEHGDPRIWISEARSSRRAGTLETTADLVPPEAQPFALDRSQIRITVLGENGAVDIRGCTGG